MSAFFEWREAPKAQYAVVGDPVGHSLSPQMHNAAFAKLAMGDKYVAVRVPKEEFAAAMDHLAAQGYKGVNVTVPLKEAAYRWAKEMPRTDRRIGTLNTLDLPARKGVNTDATGFMDTLRDLGVDLHGDVLVLGAGGTTRAIAVALEEAGSKLRFWNRTRTNLEKMLHELRISATVLDAPDPTDCRLVVNTTSASMQGAKIEIEWYSAPRSALAYDVWYAQGPTVFTFDAEANGIKAVDGKRLLVAQGARSFEWWTGQKAPREDMLSAVP